MSKIVASADITLLDIAVLMDLSVASPTITVTNLSTVVNAANLQWVFEVYSPSKTPVYIGSFDAPDVDGTAFTTFLIPVPLPLVFRQIEFSKSNQYTVKVLVKDDAGETYDYTIGSTPLCKPNGNNGKNNFGASDIDLEVKCGSGQMVVRDKTNLIFNNLEGTQHSISVALTYPKDEYGNVLDPVAVASIPAMLPIKYEGEGHEIYVVHIYDYDMGNNWTVRVRYSFTKVFPVWCNVTLYPLFCEIGKITDVLKVNCNDLDTADSRADHKKLNLVNALMLKAHTGIIQPLTGFDVPAIVEEIKDILGVDCDCCRPAGISNVGSTLLTDANLTVNKECGDMLLSWENDGEGNIVLNYRNFTYVFAMSEDAASSTAFEWQNTATDCVKTRTLFVDRLALAGELLTEIQNNPTLTNILNDITQRAQLTCSGLDGGAMFNLSTCDYSVELSTAVSGTTFTSILIGGTTYTAPGGTLLTDAASIQSFLNALSKGTFVVVYSSGTNKTTITSAANTNSIATVTTTTSGTEKITAVSNNCGLICTILQKIFDAFNALNLVQIKAGLALTICRFNSDGTVLSKNFTADDTASSVVKYMADSFCNISNYISDKLLTCANIGKVYADFTDTTGNPAPEDVVHGTKNGSCQQIPIKNLAMSIFNLLTTDADVKSVFCNATPCASVSTCSSVTGLSGTVGDTSASYTWDAVAGAIGYKWSKDGTNWFTVTSTAANVTGLTAATAYIFRVYPLYSNGPGVDCEVTDEFTTTDAGTACATPANLVLSSVTSTSFTATWDAVAGVSGYQVRINGGSWVNIGNVLVRNVTGLTPDTLYNFEVRGIIGGNPCAANVATDSVTTSVGVTENISITNGVDNLTLTNVQVGGVDFFTETTGSLPLSSSASVAGIHVGFSGVITLSIFGSTFLASCATLSINGTPEESIGIPAGVADDYDFTTLVVLETDQVEIVITEGGCGA